MSEHVGDIERARRAIDLHRYSPAECASAGGHVTIKRNDGPPLDGACPRCGVIFGDDARPVNGGELIPDELSRLGGRRG